MSGSLSMKWFNHLLFGHTHSYTPPSEELERLALRMEAEKIDWPHIMRHGGLTAVPYHVHGDLSMLLEYLEKTWHDPNSTATLGTFRTRTVSRFWDQLRVLMASKLIEKPLPLPSTNDDAILKDMLLSQDTTSSSYAYESAAFWGDIARRFLNVRKPLPEVAATQLSCADVAEKTVLLYDVTCQSRGEYLDPLSMVLVPRSEYLNPVHWQSTSLLERFMKNEPLHPFTQTIQSLLQRSIDEWLEGCLPSALLSLRPQWEAFLHNIHVIHTQIPEVPYLDQPPKQVDVIQRLLAICHLDQLWEKQVTKRKVSSILREGMDMYWLTERLQIVERENKLLWMSLRERD